MKLKKNVLVQGLGKIKVAYNNDDSTLHELNDTAYLILSKLSGGWTKERIVKKMAKDYQINYKTALKDFDDFVKVLKKKNLIE